MTSAWTKTFKDPISLQCQTSSSFRHSLGEEDALLRSCLVPVYVLCTVTELHILSAGSSVGLLWSWWSSHSRRDNSPAAGSAGVWCLSPPHSRSYDRETPQGWWTAMSRVKERYNHLQNVCGNYHLIRFRPLKHIELINDETSALKANYRTVCLS